MNDADTDANTKAIDSLLNFETVKYFGNEEHEARALRPVDGRAMRRRRSRPGPRSTVLNAGQAVVFSIGLAVVMVMAAHATSAPGAQTVGDFVMINALMIQLYMPLNFIGSVYRDIKQGLIDVEEMFDAARCRRRDHATGRAPRRSSSGKGEIVFDDVQLRL